KGDSSTRAVNIANVDTTSEHRRYERLLARYSAGDRTARFLRHFALMAARQMDYARATDAGNEFLRHAPEPYSDETWGFAKAVTRTSHDRGFRMFLEKPGEANAALGKSEAEKKAREVIIREEIEPWLANDTSDMDRGPEWEALENSVRGKYGPLGAEAVFGKAMMYFVSRRDWERFGHYYMVYFSSAFERSDYPVDNLSYLVLKHVADPNVL